MKSTKRFAAVVLALLMALSVPVAAFAEGQDTFELSINSTSLYAGMSYEVTAKITDVTAQQTEGINAFSWDITSDDNTASISSKNNFSKKDNGNGTYTVSETASFVMPGAGKSAVISAAFGEKTKSLNISSLTPIESFTVDFQNNDHAYFDTAINTLYIDRKASKNSNDEFANFEIQNITPAVSDDEIAVTLSGISYSKAELSRSENTYILKIANDATGAGTINCLTNSGKTLVNYGFQVCIPAKSYALNVTPYGSKTASKYAEISDAQDVEATLSGVAGKPFSINASGEMGNDDIVYELYTDSALTNKAPEKYYTVTDKKCELSIDTPGTFYLTSQNYSKDNKMLQRGLGKIITKIIISRAYPIQSIELFKLDEDNNKTDETLDEITLYTNTSTATSTYNLANSVTVDPISNTDSIEYSSSNPSVAKVDAATGVITAVAKGETTVWVKSADNSNAIASVNVTVKIGVKAITRIAKADGSTEIPSGHMQQLVITTNPAVVDEPIYWSTSNPEVLSIDSLTGVITANEVTESTPVTVYAITESGISSNTPLNVVPANRATSLTLETVCDSETVKVDTSTAYTTYTDYYQTDSRKRKPFTVTASAPGADSTQTNDELVWRLSYNSSPMLSLNEAVSEGYINLTKNSDSSYSITPQKLGTYTVTCTATTNITAPQATDPSDTIIIEMVQTATTMSVKDGSNNAATTIYLPIGAKKEITVKTSTADNDKHIDPPTCKIVSGSDYINLSEKVSDDGEGITYTIEGLSYGMEASKLTFASASGSKSVTISFYVRNNLNDVEVRGIEESVEYTGAAITFPDLELYYGGSSVDLSLYTVKYTDNKNVGTATITLTGKNEYNGSIRIITFSIVPKPFDDTLTISDIADQKLSSKDRTAEPKPSVNFNNTKLKINVDYTLTYKNNDKAGNATAVITGIGNYSGTATAKFKVIDTAELFTVSSIPVAVYSAKEIKPSPTVKYMGKTLKKDVDYTLSYSANINPGTATVTVSGISYYKDSIKTTFIIKPKKIRIVTLSKDKKQFTATWSLHPNVSGYQVQYALNKKFTKKKKTLTVSSGGTSSTVISKLKKRKYYYVKVRAYVEVNGVKYYGAWSKVKRVKTK